MPKIDETVIGFAVYEDATEYIGISEGPGYGIRRSKCIHVGIPMDQYDLPSGPEHLCDLPEHAPDDKDVLKSSFVRWAPGGALERFTSFP